ncbi:glutamate racemase [Marinitoga hydrogenitolerans DSM 16785]|uniref:Glutamate racemase n=1 Tax=Marinitoga hydrogenitolerans (strain DSM 16785 / JCM 12826 / AT1271) TaxID=1122195 RepID=A0A1M4S4U9_MARH1|nr:glutamate racemase [Marinitoga hydrogenitolerans]SHE27037.1 glutamate racemase [Marinitoga hydrogenitolerans DSM 16785]
MKIGFFDSGIGGLTVLKKVVNTFKGHQYFYFGDTLNVPYGSKPIKKIINILKELFQFYDNLGIDIVVSACNTSDSIILRDYIDMSIYNFRYISILKNAISQIDKKEKVLLLATENTVKTGTYRELLVTKKTKLTEIPCPLFVPLIEEGIWHGPIAESIVNFYLKNQKEYDKIILGCTHYPILEKHIKKSVKGKIIDPADGIVESLKSYLSVISSPPKIHFFVSGDKYKFIHNSERILGRNNYKVQYSTLVFGETGVISW